jgi:mono/diheme cytochrome c family protein
MAHRLIPFAAVGILLAGISGAVHAADDAIIKQGRQTFSTYCAPCHGPEGAGLLAPNLTDAEVLHGESLAEIVKVIGEGVPARSMPPWGGVLDDATTEATAHYVMSIMDDNLPNGMVATPETTVTPFPFGSAEEPYILRTFMPTMGVGDEVFPHHGNGMATPRYKADGGTFDIEKMQDPIDGVPGAVVVNFGEALSYCFDTTECRLLYTWQGGFMDMTDYWGAGQGGSRKKFGYVPTVLGNLVWRTDGPSEFRGRPHFRSYRKVEGAPEFNYEIGDLQITLLITPSDEPGVAHCYYTVTDSSGHKRSFSRFLHRNIEEDAS